MQHLWPLAPRLLCDFALGQAECARVSLERWPAQSLAIPPSFRIGWRFDIRLSIAIGDFLSLLRGWLGLFRLRRASFLLDLMIVIWLLTALSSSLFVPTDLFDPS